MLLKALFEKLGFDRKDLKIIYFNVDTEYEGYQDKDKSWKRRFKGYKYTVSDVEKCKNELLHKAVEDSVQKAQVLADTPFKSKGDGRATV